MTGAPTGAVGQCIGPDDWPRLRDEYLRRITAGEPIPDEAILNLLATIQVYLYSDPNAGQMLDFNPLEQGDD